MNSELQAQSDVLIKAIRQLETTMHQDIILATALIGALIFVLTIIMFVRR
jgi:hypothetical protein